jgi:hypothetical protein
MVPKPNKDCLLLTIVFYAYSGPSEFIDYWPITTSSVVTHFALNLNSPSGSYLDRFLRFYGEAKAIVIYNVFHFCYSSNIIDC